MIYPALSGFLSGITGYFYGKKKADQSIQVSQSQVPNTYRSDTIQGYTQWKRQNNRSVLYSRLHQCALATHQIIVKNELSKQQKNTDTQQLTTSTKNETGKKQIRKNLTKNQYFSSLFQNYGQELVNSNLCESVQLLYGPIFSKDVQYKDQTGKPLPSVFKSPVKITSQGEYVTDRQYAIVVCNRKDQKYVNGFTYRSIKHSSYRLINYLTAIKTIEQQTGLTFNIEGPQLTRINYQGISKQRLHDDV